ncbi:MAG: tetratricopeptide repeat protein [Chlamydiota bacterium]
MNTRILIVVGALLSLSIAAVIVGRHRAAKHAVLKENAVQLIREGRSGAAISLLRQALDVKPNYAEAYHALGIAYGTLGDAATAEACFRRAIALKPEYPAAVYNLASVCERQRRYDEALALLAQAEAMKPEYPGARAARARIYFTMGKDAIEAGDVAKGEKLFVRAVETDPASVDAHYGLGRLYQRTGRYKEAVAQFTLVTQMKPGAKVGPALRDAYARIGEERVGAGDFAAAVEAYRRALILDEKNGALRYRHGAALVRQGNCEAGGKELAEARRLKAEVKPDAELAADLVARAKRALAAGDLDGAAGWLDLATRVDLRAEVSAERAGISLARGDRAWEAGDAVLALRHYRETEKAAAGTPGIEEKLARALAAAGERDEAIERYERLLEKDPGNRECLVAAGNVYLAAGEFARAEEKFSALGGEGGEHLRGCYEKWLSAEKDPARMLPVFEKYLQVDPDNDAVRALMFLTMARLGRYREAVAGMERVIEKHPPPRRPSFDHFRPKRITGVRVAEGIEQFKGLHQWVFSSVSEHPKYMGSFTVRAGRQAFQPTSAPPSLPYGTTLLYEGPDAVSKESALEILYDDRGKYVAYLPPLKAGTRLYLARDGFTYAPGFSAIGRSDIPREIPPYSEYNYLLGLIHRESGNKGEAKRVARYHCEWGSIFTLVGLFSLGEKELRRALEIDEDSFDSRSTLSSLYFRQRRYDDAAREAAAAASMRPDDPIPVNDLGVIYAARGSINEAEQQFLRAVEMDKKFITPCYNLAVLYKRRKMPSERKFWEKMIRIMETAKPLEDGLTLSE